MRKKSKKGKKSGSENKKIIFVCLAVMSAFLFVIFLTPQEISRGGDSVSGFAAVDTDAEAKTNRGLGLGEKMILGDLELSVTGADEETYSIKVPKRIDTGSDYILKYEPVTKTFEKVYVSAFNPTAADIVFNSIKLLDDIGEEYGIDSNPSDADLVEFGRDPIVSPSTLRKGYLIFLDVSKDARTLQLVFELESGEEGVFEFER
ncbi:MAG TPA: hypothetical protein VJB08_05020 [Candidatus Nanoarchaeia archaeon]|nr:hypothetical protein [Candidatus Nanoarchaeia archaeon]